MNIKDIEASLKQEFPSQRLEISSFLRKLQRQPKAATIYLWGCSEGWFRIGSYSHLIHDIENNCYKDANGTLIASKSENGWVALKGGKSFQLSHIFSTTDRLLRGRDISKDLLL